MLVGPGAVVILLLSLLSVSVSADGVTSTSETEPLQLADWMELVPDDTALSDLAIPGTHDSATANSGQAAIFQPWVETQHWTLKEQLQSGVRAFDIRLTPQNQIAHGNFVVTGFCDTESPSACSSFEHVIREFEEFLDVHPSETVLMRVQENCIDGQACDSALTKSVMKTAVESSTADFWQANSGEAGGTDADADIGDLRGKIAFLDDPYALDTGDHVPVGFLRADNESHSVYWEAVNLDDAWSDRSDLFDGAFEAMTTPSTDSLRETWFSNTTFPGTAPSAWADYMNDRLFTKAAETEFDLTGLVFTDFPGPALVAYLVAHNLSHAETVAAFASEFNSIITALSGAGASTELRDFMTRESGRHGFADTPVTGWQGDAASWMLASGVTSGCRAMAYCPGQEMTREQQITFLWRYAGEPAAGADSPFTDVAAGRYFTEPVAWAYNNGITNGVGGGLFGTGDPVTRAQAVTFLWRQAGEPAPTGDNPFTDVEAGRWFTDPIRWAFETGVTTGTSATTFSPNEAVTRVQFAAFLSRYDNLD